MNTGGTRPNSLVPTETIQNILTQRGVCTEEQQQAFLSPRLADLPSPFLMRDMDKAVQLICRAMAEHQTVIVYGDYDVDGTSATVLLANFFSQHLGLMVMPHQPHRLRQGYGVHADDVRRLVAAAGPRPLLVTVDCGISAVEEVALAKEMGCSVLITDHHLVVAPMPAADAILNPRRKECDFPDKNLAGVGVAFFLLMGIRSKLVHSGSFNQKHIPNLKAELDLVALGTIADVVSLQGVNRILVKAGLEVMARQTRIGVASLMEKAGLAPSAIGGREVAFRLTPRLNAAGRMGNVEIARELLATSSREHAGHLAEELERVNRERQEMTSQVMEQAREECRRRQVMTPHGLTIWGSWHAGVIGIVAARLAEELCCPVAVLSLEGELLKGSLRSVPGVDLSQVLQQCAEFLLKFGGHAAAGGLTMERSQVEAFSRKFDSIIGQQVNPEPLREENSAHRITTRDLLDETFLGQYELLEPFGCGNPEPVFDLCDAIPQEIRTFGRQGDHLGFVLRDNGVRLDGVAFNMALCAETLMRGRTARLRCSLRRQHPDRGGGYTVHAMDLIDSC